EKNFLNSIDFELRSHGITHVECCRDSRNVMALLKSKKYSVILLDILMPHITGDELLPQIVEAFPELPVIVVTAFPDKETSINCMKKGAFDCHTKPIDTKELIRTIRNALELKGIRL
ncbi:MAG TPA: response regulator, partial [Candidatus Deferrimicrobium sp.]|nr:response regulator [Candidatus Deferrimicrobium sp.]